MCGTLSVRGLLLWLSAASGVDRHWRCPVEQVSAPDTSCLLGPERPLSRCCLAGVPPQVHCVLSAVSSV